MHAMQTAAAVSPASVSPASSLSRGLPAAATAGGWRLDALAGRLVEVSGGPAGAALTLTFRIVLEAQTRGEPVAWVAGRGSTFFPPDAAALGVDLAALAVVRADGALRALRAADHLVRSGGFGLVALDLGTRSRMPVPIQSRLAGLARKHHTALLCLTERSSELPSLGPLVSLRVETTRTRGERGRFGCRVDVLKDRRGGGSWQHLEVCHGPDGLC